MQATKTMSTFEFHKDILAKTVSREEEILDFILFDRSLGNAVARNEIIYKLWRIDERYQKNNGVHLKSGYIVLCFDIFLHLD